MAQILSILGFRGGDFRTGEPVQVYLGRDDEAGESAIAASDCESFIVHRNLGAGHRRGPTPKPAPVEPVVENEESDTDEDEDASDADAPDKPKKAAKKKASKKAK